MSMSRVAHSNGTRTTSMPSAMVPSSDESLPTKRWKDSRSAVSTVTRKPASNSAFAVASVR
jgi:hypothetical protein